MCLPFKWRSKFLVRLDEPVSDIIEEYIVIKTPFDKKKGNTQSFNILPAYLCVGKTLHIVFAGSRSAPLLWFLVIVAVVGLTLRA